MDREQIFLFPGETLVDTIHDKGIRFDIVEREEAIWCGTLGHATNPTGGAGHPGAAGGVSGPCACGEAGTAGPGLERLHQPGLLAGRQRATGNHVHAAGCHGAAG